MKLTVNGILEECDEAAYETIQADNEQAYLDRVALEAMKEFIRGANKWSLGDAEFVDEFCSETANASYAMSRAMLKARSQGGAE